jgi:cytochrome P450
VRDVAVGDAADGGVTIGEGRKVLLFLGAANRDPRRWGQPDDYEITRRAAGHVGFGTGIHGCVGAVLARLEGEVVLTALARKVARIEIAGTPRRRYNNTLRGLASLPMRLHAA